MSLALSVVKRAIQLSKHNTCNIKMSQSFPTSNVYDTLENEQPSIFYLISIIAFNVVFLTVCGGLVIIAKKFLKSIPPGRKLVCVKSKES